MTSGPPPAEPLARAKLMLVRPLVNKGTGTALQAVAPHRPAPLAGRFLTPSCASASPGPGSEGSGRGKPGSWDAGCECGLEGARGGGLGPGPCALRIPFQGAPRSLALSPLFSWCQLSSPAAFGNGVRQRDSLLILGGLGGKEKLNYCFDFAKKRFASILGRSKKR